MMSSMTWIINSNKWMNLSTDNPDLDKIKEDKLHSNNSSSKLKEHNNNIIDKQTKIFKQIKGDNRCNNNLDVPINKIIFNLHNSEINKISILQTEIIQT